MAADLGARVVTNFSAPVWRSGFRPFFLLAAGYGPLLILVWPALPLFLGAGLAAGPGLWPPALWHGHELLFGFAACVICGFVLTALPSWAGTEPVEEGRLAFLAAVWMAGRLAIWASPWLPPVLVALVDLALFPCLAALIVPGILKLETRRYLALIPVLALLFAGNALVHFGGEQARLGLRLAFYAIMVLFTLVGGFLTPVFTENDLRARGWPGRIAFNRPIEFLAVASVLAFAVTGLRFPGTVWSLAAAVIACGVHAARLLRWKFWLVLDQPVLLVTHAAYAWLVASFALRALAEGGLAPPVAGDHAFTVGALGMMMIGLFCRVTLRHTGRPVIASPAMIAAFLIMAAAPLLRVTAAWEGGLWLAVSALLWAMPFLIYLASMGWMLTAPSLPKATS